MKTLQQIFTVLFKVDKQKEENTGFFFSSGDEKNSKTNKLGRDEKKNSFVSC